MVSPLKSILTAFNEANLKLAVKDDCFLVNGSEKIERICNIVAKAKFLPIFNEQLSDDKWAFTVVPYKIPETFTNPITYSLPKTIEIPALVSKYFRVLNEDTTKLKSQQSYLPNDHYENNKKEIEQLLDNHGADIKTAVILGPGFCDDIPLERIVAHCDLVTMMEIDKKTLEEAINKLPAELQSKVVPVVCDLSGVMNYFMSRYEAITQYITFEEAQTIYDDILRKSRDNRCDFPALEKYDFVISSMMANQLSAQSHNSLIEMLDASLDPQEEEMLSPEAQSAEYKKFFEWVTKNHLQHIEDLATPNGIIYFSDQMYCKDTFFNFGNLISFGLEKYPVQTEEVRMKLFLQYHKVISQNEWEWDLKLPKTDPETGDLELGWRMTVCSYAYHPWSTLL